MRSRSILIAYSMGSNVLPLTTLATLGQPSNIFSFDFDQVSVYDIQGCNCIKY